MSSNREGVIDRDIYKVIKRDIYRVGYEQNKLFIEI